MTLKGSGSDTVDFTDWMRFMVVIAVVMMIVKVMKVMVHVQRHEGTLEWVVGELLNPSGGLGWEGGTCVWQQVVSVVLGGCIVVGGP